MISSVFWLLNALSKNYTTSINYPIEIVNYPAEKVAVGNLPDHLTIQVKGTGYTLFQYKANPFLQNFIVDLEQYNLIPLSRKNPYDFFIRTEELKLTFQKFFSSDLELVAIFPDSLNFHFADMGVKKVQVIADIQINLDALYKLKNKIIITPDSVVINGPVSILDTLKFIKTAPYIYNFVNKTIAGKVDLKEYKYISLSDNQVDVLIEVEKFTEKSLKIPVEIINIPDSLSIEFFPKNVDLTFKVGLSQFNVIDTNSFRIVTDYQKIENNIGNKLNLDLIKYPDNVDDIDFNPKSINYIIRK